MFKPLNGRTNFGGAEARGGGVVEKRETLQRPRQEVADGQRVENCNDRRLRPLQQYPIATRKSAKHGQARLGGTRYRLGGRRCMGPIEILGD